VKTTMSSLQFEIEALKSRIELIAQKTDHHENILIRGYGEQLPLAEIVRNLSTTVQSYIAQKDKEEQQRKEQWDKLKWLVVGILAPAIILFFGQAVVFFFKIFPILEKLEE